MDNISVNNNNMKRKVLYTYDENKLETLTKKMFGEQYTFSKMSEREKGMIKNEYNAIYR